MIESVSHVSLNLFRHCPVRICALLCAISMAQPATAEAEAPPAQAVYESLGVLVVNTPLICLTEAD